ncbi:NHL domain-containing protein [Granulicella arctica]|uniref:NHL domain-containing protein n=1 Tax=Granulicella arctica TaxID=940613 RepID=UPI0021DF6270|nr:Ig-like domain repeat protein [Granulicella arctica]
MLCLVGSGWGQAIPALSVPLLLPGAIAFDGQGNLFLAETNRHVIRRVDLTGAITTIAGNGTQGFSGDGGSAAAARLDSPTGIVVDTAGNVFIADSHNQRVRRIDAISGMMSTVAGNGLAGFGGDGGAATRARLDQPAALALDGSGNLFIADSRNHRIRQVAIATGVITTFAGSGLQGFSGDGGPAIAAPIDSPSGLAVDVTGNLYLADMHNHRVRKVSVAGLISTVAGTGNAGFAGDGGVAAKALLALPRGLSVDAAGNVYVADANNQRVRRIAIDGTMTTVAGDGTQTLSGDGGLAPASGLNTPRGTAISPAGLVTLADAGNERVRQINAADVIVTIAGLGAALQGSLMMASPSTMTYGTSLLTATLSTSGAATGGVTFFESVAMGTNTLGSTTLTNNVAVVSLPGLSAGVHQVFSRYSGDLSHAAAQSFVSQITVAPLSVTGSAVSTSIIYGQVVPVLTASLSGVLSQDAATVALVLSTAATTLSPVGSYSVNGALTGTAAGNYRLVPLIGAAVTIGKASSVATITSASTSVVAGTPLTFSMKVVSATSGTPTGTAAVLDGGALVATVPLSGGAASFATSALGIGSHALSLAYAGDGNFLESTATSLEIAVTLGATGDFVLALTGPSGQTIASGGAASFSFAAQTQGVALSSPIVLAASALPVGFTASFNPAYLPPGGAVTTFTLTVQTSKAAAANRAVAIFAGVVCSLLPFWWRRRFVGAVMLSCLLLAGCGDRVVTAGGSAALVSYPITVTGTATTPSGAILQHTALVTLSVQ